MYRIAAIVDNKEEAIIEIGDDIDVGKFLFWMRANDYSIISVEKVSELHHPKNSDVGKWIIDLYKSEEKFHDLSR